MAGRFIKEGRKETQFPPRSTHGQNAFNVCVFLLTLPKGTGSNPTPPAKSYLLWMVAKSISHHPGNPLEGFDSFEKYLETFWFQPWLPFVGPTGFRPSTVANQGPERRERPEALTTMAKSLAPKHASSACVRARRFSKWKNVDPLVFFGGPQPQA